MDIVRVKYEVEVLDVCLRYYGRLANDVVNEVVERAIKKETARLLLADPRFKEAVTLLAGEKLVELLENR